MILVYGRGDDPPTARTAEALQDIGAPYVMLEQRALAHEGICIDAESRGVDGVLISGGQAVPLGDVHAVYARPLEFELQTDDAVAAAQARFLHELLMEWLDVTSALVVNRPRAMQSNASKPLQLQAVGAAGFLVPETLVTNDIDEARAFWRAEGRVIYKSTSGIRSIVRELDEASARRLPLIEALPVQFQAYVPGVDVRVHVVGKETYAAEIHSDCVDYRYAARDGGKTALKATVLPDDVAARCVTLAASMELPLAGIDLRQRPDGEYVCFEVNPMPAYTYFESHTDLQIGEAIARLLCNVTGNGKEVRHGPGNGEPDPNQWQDHRPPAASHAR
jgi:glutathione synthase/RimK-type ligase-like ATP-grasp enzyme